MKKQKWYRKLPFYLLNSLNFTLIELSHDSTWPKAQNTCFKTKSNDNNIDLQQSMFKVLLHLLSHPFFNSKTILSFNIGLSAKHCWKKTNCKLNFFWPGQHLIIPQNSPYSCKSNLPMYITNEHET